MPARRNVSPSASSPTPLDSLSTTYQLLSILCLHYLTLCVFIPPFLSVFSASVPALQFEGGPAQVGMILDWREVASRKTFDWSVLMPGVDGAPGWLNWKKGVATETLLQGLDEADKQVAKHWKMGDVWLGDLGDSTPSVGGRASRPVLLDADRILREGMDFLNLGGNHKGAASPTLDADAQDLQAELAEVATSASGGEAEANLEQWEWKMTRDPSRGWSIAAAWMVACAVDVFLLTTIVRRPKHMLDYVVTMHLVHLLLTSWYSSSIPTSLFWWAVMVSHATGCVLWSERLAIGREMRTSVGHGLVGTGPSQAMDEEERRLNQDGGTHGDVTVHEAASDDDEGDEDQGEASVLVKKPSMSTTLTSMRSASASPRPASPATGEAIPMKALRSKKGGAK